MFIQKMHLAIMFKTLYLFRISVGRTLMFPGGDVKGKISNPSYRIGGDWQGKEMFTLFYGLWKYIFQRDEYFVLILGLDNAGKTTYLEQTKTKFCKGYKGLNPNKITTTVGLNIGKIDVHGIRLNFWDLGGQEELQSLWDKYYAESHAVIYIIDSSDKVRVDESKTAFEKMIQSESLHGAPLLVLANKQDIDDCLSVAEIKQAFRDSAHNIGRRDCHTMGVSALKGNGVHEGIEWVINCVKRNSILRPPRKNDDT